MFTFGGNFDFWEKLELYMPDSVNKETEEKPKYFYTPAFPLDDTWPCSLFSSKRLHSQKRTSRTAQKLVRMIRYVCST